MNEDIKNSPEENQLKDLPLTLEDVGFATDRMIACGKCGRLNPPTRTGCFYCAADLPVGPENADDVRPNLRQLEAWEKGFNLVVVGEQISKDADFRTAERQLSLESGTLERILELGGPVPLLRVEKEPEADIISSRLDQMGVECEVISDETLLAEKMPRRIRALEFSGDKLITVDFNTGQRAKIASDELVLIVTGVLFESRVEDIGKRKSGKTKPLEQYEVNTDLRVVDFYTRDDTIRFRILTSGFDFSCLGAKKGMLAGENILQLVDRLSGFAPRAKLVDDYGAAADLLGTVWEIERRSDSQGLTRTGFGKTTFNTASESNNMLQFTKYSRMQSHFL